MTISKAGVVCAFMTQVGPSFRCETVVVSRPELLGLAKMTTNKGFLCLSLISIAGIAPYCPLFPSHKSGETELVLLMKSYLQVRTEFTQCLPLLPAENKTAGSSFSFPVFFTMTSLSHLAGGLPHFMLFTCPV